MLDSAVMRPGRLDQLVYLPLPDLECRRAIFGAATRKSPLAADISLDDFAARTEGYSGADLAGLLRAAASYSLERYVEEAMLSGECR